MSVYVPDFFPLVVSVIQPVSCLTTGQQHDSPNVHCAFTGMLLVRFVMGTLCNHTAVTPFTCLTDISLSPLLILSLLPFFPPFLPPSLPLSLPPSLSPSLPPSFPQNRMLVSEHGLLEKIIGTLLELLEPCVDPTSQTYKLRSSNYKHSRLAYIMYDLRWVEPLVM